MALALQSAAPLHPDVILAQAISEFERALPPAQKAALDDLRVRSLRSAPSRDDVMRLTADVNRRLMSRKRSSGLSRCFGTRFTNVLQCVQRYAALGDVVVGGSQNILACGIWSVVRMTIQVCIDVGSYLDKVSHFFMVAGQTAPRYEEMGQVYRRSQRLSRFLSQYFTVIVRTCHNFILFSQKSALAQITSSLDDSKIRDAQAGLERLSRQIREEVSFLTSEKVEEEGKENNTFRALVTSNHKRQSERQKLRQKALLLQALSAMDHETSFKQARRCGTSTVFQQSEVYDDWKDSYRSSALLLSGKLGSGKSVTMANIVDDLYLSQSSCGVAYVFCRHDNADSLTARAVMGSLSRQLVDKFFNDSLLDNFVEGAPIKFDMEDVLRLSKEVATPNTHIYFVLDGLDECSEYEAGEILKALQKLSLELKLSVCISCRTGADAHADLLKSWGGIETLTIPDSNPDIESFIQEELQRRIECKKLVLGNPSIILEIRNALLQGANGMFLWVALQLDCICEEESDRDIRAALEDLPPDLFSTYARILKGRKVSSQQRSSLQMRILKLIAAAYRPLNVHELREVISVEPGNTNWDPEQEVSNIYHALSCCGSLVLVDEEDLSVRAIHQSVMQFLTTETETHREYHFSLLDAHRHMGECAVTYLSSSPFETRVSTKRAGPVLVGQLPNKVIHETLAPSGMAGQLALRLLRSAAAKPADFDANKTLAEAANRPQRQKPIDIFHFREYASRHWLRHTARISPKSEVYRLWVSLLEDPRFNVMIWPETSAPRNDPVFDDDTECIWYLAERVIWAISNAHIPLLRLELRGSGWCRAFASIVPYLRRCISCNPRHRLERDMCTVLLPLVAMFHAPGILEWLLSMGASDPSRPSPASLVNDDRHYRIARARVHVQGEIPFSYNIEALFQGSVRRKDVQAAKYLSSVTRQPLPLHHALTADLEDPAIVRLIYGICKGAVTLRNYDVNTLVIDIKVLSHSVNPRVWKPGPDIFQVALRRSFGINMGHLLPTALNHYSLRADWDLLHALLSPRYGGSNCVVSMALRQAKTSDAPLNISTLLTSCILNILHSVSKQRAKMIQRIYELPPYQSEFLELSSAEAILTRCIQLRQWDLAENFLRNFRRRLTKSDSTHLTEHLRSYVLGNKFLCTFAEALDSRGLGFMFIEIELRLETTPTCLGPNPWELALRAEVVSPDEFYAKMVTLNILLRFDTATQIAHDAAEILLKDIKRFDKAAFWTQPMCSTFEGAIKPMGYILSELARREVATELFCSLVNAYVDFYVNSYRSAPVTYLDDDFEVVGRIKGPDYASDRSIKRAYVQLIARVFATGKVSSEIVDPLAPAMQRMLDGDMDSELSRLLEQHVPR